MTVAALYVDPAGVYANLPGVEVWDEARDARLYDGPWPVVAHPPCNRWGSLAFLNRALHGYQIGDDGGCFEAALDAVRRFGGVLEHPAGSLAWRRYDLPPPARGTWTRTLLDDGWVTEVDQAAYGHRARKRTWLYCRDVELPELDWRPVNGTAKVSSFNHHPAGAYVPDEASRVRPREASATPPAFRDVLLGMARTAHGASPGGSRASGHAAEVIYVWACSVCGCADYVREGQCTYHYDRRWCPRCSCKQPITCYYATDPFIARPGN